MENKIEIKNNELIILGGYNIREYIRLIPGARYKKNPPRWTIPINASNAEKFKRLQSAIGISENILAQIEQMTQFKYPSEGVSMDTIIKHLYTHQRRSVNVARQTLYFADLSDPGTGKTLVQIELMLERDEWPVLVICPKSIIEAVWLEQLAEYGINVVTLSGGGDRVKRILREYAELVRTDKRSPDNTVFVINYELVRIVLTELQSISWSTIILDESTRIKNHAAKRSKAVIKLRDISKYRNIMTGTVAPNSAMDMFNQFRFLNPKLFGDSIWAFRERYFRRVHRRFGDKAEFDDWVIKPESINEIKKIIAHCSVQHKKRDCLDLPDLVNEVRLVELGADEMRHYTSMKQDFLIMLERHEQEHIITAPFVTTQLAKLRQICSGFIYDGTGDTLRVGRSKLSELIALVETLGDEQVIVFTHFVQSTHALAAALENKYKVSLFDGGSDERSKAIDDFVSGRTQIFLSNYARTAHGLNLQQCSNMIYFELDFNLENYLQSKDRINRIGQKNKMTVFHLLAKGTIDEYIYKKLQRKEDLNRKLDLSELRRELERENL